MLFQKATEYALRTLLYLAVHSSSTKKISIDSVANGIDSPKAFTAKIIQQLTHSSCGLVQSAPGPRGGLFLTPSVLEMSVLDVLQLLGQAKVLCHCVLGLAECSDANPCAMHEEYKLIRKSTIELFGSRTFGMLASESGKRASVLSFSK